MTTNTKREELQKKIAIARQQKSRYGRYSRELKSEIMSYARTRLEKGVPVTLLAEDLGLNGATLWNWMQQEPVQRDEEATEESRAREHDRISADKDEQ